MNWPRGTRLVMSNSPITARLGDSSRRAGGRRTQAQAAKTARWRFNGVRRSRRGKERLARPRRFLTAIDGVMSAEIAGSNFRQMD